MDAFEQIIGQLLEEEKYWVRHSVKIELTPIEKKTIGKPSTPRPEIDIVALDIKSNTLFLFEVKSFLDSSGVHYEAVIVEQEQQEGRYKLLTSENYRAVLWKRLRTDWLQSGHINSDTKISFGLIAGKVHKNRESDLIEYFAEKNWLFWGPTIIKEKLQKLATKGYENNAVTIAAKLLTRI
jgi:hypothetical protein